MIYLVTADIHGSSDGIRLLEAAGNCFNADAFLSAGDQCPDPAESFYSSLIAVRGNCDRFWEYDSMPFPPVFRELSLNKKRAAMTHGDRLSHDDFDLEPGDIFISGHTHVPLLAIEDGIILLNPGSPSRPRSSYGPTAAIIDEERISLISLGNMTVIKSLCI